MWYPTDHPSLGGTPRIRRLERLGVATLVALALAFMTASDPSLMYAQQASVAAASQDSLVPYVRVYAAIAALRDKAQGELADPTSKKPEVLTQVRERLRAQIAQALKVEGLSQEQYDRITHTISIDPEQRRRFDAMLAELPTKKE